MINPLRTFASIAGSILLVLTGVVRAQVAPPLWPEVAPPPLRVFGLGFLSAYSMSPDGEHIATAGSRGVWLWDLSSGGILGSYWISHGYEEAISAIAFSGDGAKLFVAGSYYDFDQRIDVGVLDVWDSQTYELLHTISVLGSTASTISVAADGSKALLGNYDGSSVLWDVETEQVLEAFHADQTDSSGYGSRAAVLSADGTKVLTGGIHSARLWDAKTSLLLRTFESTLTTPAFGPVSPNSVAFSPDGSQVLGGFPAVDNVLRLWDATTGQLLRTFEGSTDRLDAVAFSPDGARVFARSLDNTARLWDKSTGRVLQTFADVTSPASLTLFSPDGKNLLVAYNASVRLLDTETQQILRRYEGHSAKFLWSVAFSVDGSKVVTGGADGIVTLWDASSPPIVPAPREPFLGAFQVSTTFVRSVMFSPDGTEILTGGPDNAARLWNLTTGEQILAFVGHTDIVAAVAFSADGAQVLTGSLDGTAKLWRAADGQAVRTFTGHANRVASVAFSPNNQFALTGSWDQTAKLWSLATGELVRTFSGHAEIVTSVAFSPDGLRVLTCSHDHTSRIWDTATGQLLLSFGGWEGGVFSPNGRLVLTLSPYGATQGATIWDALTGDWLRSYVSSYFMPLGIMEAAAFSPDGRQVLGTWGPIAVTWDVSDLLVRLRIRSAEGHLEIRWDTGLLQHSDRIDGPWEDIPGASSPYIADSAAGAQYYRVRIEP